MIIIQWLIVFYKRKIKFLINFCDKILNSIKRLIEWKRYRIFNNVVSIDKTKAFIYFYVINITVLNERRMIYVILYTHICRRMKIAF